MKYFASAIVVCLILIPAGAQHAHSMTENKPAVLMPGFGELHHPVSTGNPEAQKFFEQGLVLIYGFNHEEAARSFKRALEIDPKLAMAYWGYALAVGPNYNEPTIDPARMKEAYDATQKAHDLATGASEAERGLIEALRKRFSLDANPDLKKLSMDYSLAMGEVARNFPDDLDAATLYADSLMNLNPWQLWSKDGKPGPQTEEIVKVLESVLRRDPNHLGANHLYIHSVEASKTPERALPSAGRLATLAPAAGHLVHMPGHIYLRTGDYDKSAQANIKAAAADREYLKQAGAKGMYGAMYFSHNLHFQVESYSRMGQFREARRAARELEANVRQYVKEMPMVEGFLPSPIFTSLRFGKWDEVLKSPAPDQHFKLTHTVWLYARGIALAAQGKVADAEKERQNFLAAGKNLPGETPFGLNSASSVLLIAERLLDAKIAQAKGNRQAAIEALRQAVAAQDALNYDEPPGWYYSVRESLGGALLLNGDAVAAEKIFREDLQQNPRNGRSLFGLVESLKKQGKLTAAQLVQREFETAWKFADIRLRIEDL